MRVDTMKLKNALDQITEMLKNGILTENEYAKFFDAITAKADDEQILMLLAD